MMNKKPLVIEGYQPVFRGYQPTTFPQNAKGLGTPGSTPSAMACTIIPPQGGTGAVRPIAK